MEVDNFKIFINKKSNGILWVRAGMLFNNKWYVVTYPIHPIIMDGDWEKREAKNIVRIIRKMFYEGN